MKRSRDHDTIPGRLIRIVSQRLKENKRIRRTLPVWGRIHIDRPLPFLCVYRKPVRQDDPGTDRLATSEASYLICSGQRRLQPGLTELVRTVAETLVGQFGSCIVLELWAGPPVNRNGPNGVTAIVPEFRVLAPRGVENAAMTDEFDEALSRIKLGSRKAKVTLAAGRKCCPPGLPPILPREVAADIGCHMYGLEVAPVYRDADTGEVFPAVLRELRRKLDVALRRTFFEFARQHTSHPADHYHALGRRAVVKAVWEVDRQLAEASEQFDFLLQLTPINGEQAWRDFQRSRFEKTPTLHYRPLPTEPVVMKRNLYKTPVERIEDPALAQLFREKLDELDRQITMLMDRNTPRFIHESMQLYGGVEDKLHNLAIEILRQASPHSREERAKEHLTPEEFAERAREEIEGFRRQYPSLKATVEVRSDVSSLMVTQGNLLVSTQSKIPLSRVEALIQHEVGTHVLTYHNGKAQKFRQLYTGLAGYDALQEGLAVLAEYLVGGLTRPRMRLLAARVVAARRMIEGAGFVDVFRELDREFEFARRTAFSVTLRIFRGGGLTKDAVYLRGLVEILDYLGKGGELEPLLVGKIAAEHIPIIRELQWRGVLRDPPLAPRYLSRPEALARLDELREGMSVVNLLARPPEKAKRRAPSRASRAADTIASTPPADATGHAAGESHGREQRATDLSTG